jgi:hypothetical protein
MMAGESRILPWLVLRLVFYDEGNFFVFWLAPKLEIKETFYFHKRTSFRFCVRREDGNQGYLETNV